ncbi:MAG: HAD-IC family P-type ATPase [Pseudomonadota bacterium]|nr:HAD-IC family P-type ATPase [Pseudomonadota bacterium]
MLYQALGLKVEVLSGDRIDVVGRTAYELGVDRWQAEMSPVDKTAHLERLARGGRKVCMVGDGTNDTPALAMAYVSISLASTADISQTAADNVFQGEGLSGVPLALRIAARANRLVKQYFFGMAFPAIC